MSRNFNSVMKMENMHLGSRDCGENGRSRGVISFSVLRAGFCAMVSSGEHHLHVKGSLTSLPSILKTVTTKSSVVLH